MALEASLQENKFQVHPLTAIVLNLTDYLFEPQSQKSVNHNKDSPVLKGF